MYAVKGFQCAEQKLKITELPYHIPRIRHKLRGFSLLTPKKLHQSSEL